jgi:hypothetical protein
MLVLLIPPEVRRYFTLPPLVTTINADGLHRLLEYSTKILVTGRIDSRKGL